jgi:hypothetical protein
MPSSAMVLDSIESSNMPSRDKSMVRRMFEKMGGLSRVGSRTHAHVSHAAHTVRQGGESILTGGVLAAIHVESPTGLDVRKVPVDLAVGLAGLVSGVALADDASQDLRNVGSTALGIYTFRKVGDMLAAKKIAAGGVPGGSKTGAKVHGDFDAIRDSDMGEDPIVEAAKRL